MTLILPVLSWWFIIQLFGWAAFPIAFRVFRWLPDRGYAFSKALGLLLVSYLLWMGAITGLLPNDVGGIVVALLVVAGISAWLMFRKPAGGASPAPEETSAGSSPLASLRQHMDFIRQRRIMIITVEILFALAFMAWALLRAYATEKIMPAGGEKFMEIAFLNAILRSPRFPPLDPWMSGFSISYYYFGYVMMAVMTRLSGVVAEVGFELYDALLFALAAVGVFGVVYNLIPEKRSKAGVLQLGQPVGYGLLGSFFLVLMGNLEGVLELLRAWGKLSDGLISWIRIKQLGETVVTGTPTPNNYWWWWHASRVVWDYNLAQPPQLIENITEFPFFSFLLGDNHPHVLNLPFVLLAIGLALNLLRAVLERRSALASQEPVAAQGRLPFSIGGLTWWNPLSGAFGGDVFQFVLYALCLGSLGFINTWDFPIYLVVTALAFGLAEYTRTRKLDWPLAGRVAALFTSLLVAGGLLFVFFYVGFSSQANGILPYIFAPTRLVNYFIMFGPFLVIAMVFLAVVLARNVKQGGMPVLRQALVSWLWVVGICAAGFTLLVLSVPLLGFVQQGLLKQIDSSVYQQVFGDLSLSDAAVLILQNRLAEPWLFLLLSAVITVAAINVFWHIRLAAEVADEHSPKFSASQMFVSLLIFAGIGLTLSVEFVYLRDTFGSRMNTIFKFYYQGWVMLACASAYAVWWLLNRGERMIGALGKTIFLGVLIVLALAGIVYPVMATVSRTNGFSAAPNLDGASMMAQQNPDDWAAVSWLRQHATAVGTPSTDGVPVILEAPVNGSYDYRGRISAFSGFPAVLGWAYHEMQWRGDFDEQGRRLQDIATIYTTHKPQDALDLLRKWNVNYVIVGATEQNYVQDLCSSGQYSCSPNTALRKFDSVLTPVFTQGSITIYQVP